MVGDVSGKGVPAALFMMRAQGLLREQIQTCEDMGAAFTAVNKLLCERNDENLFVTAFACVLDCETGHVVFANAGHNPPLVIRANAPEYFRPRRVSFWALWMWSATDRVSWTLPPAIG